jgi:hypothetical protein
VSDGSLAPAGCVGWVDAWAMALLDHWRIDVFRPPDSMLARPDHCFFLTFPRWLSPIHGVRTLVNKLKLSAAAGILVPCGMHGGSLAGQSNLLLTDGCWMGWPVSECLLRRYAVQR